MHPTCESIDNLADAVSPVAANQVPHGNRLELNAENAAKGLGRLAVAIVNLLHELLEKQAIRRMEHGTLTDEQIESLGECLMQQSDAIDHLCKLFGLQRQDLNLDLGPLGKLL